MTASPDPRLAALRANVLARANAYGSDSSIVVGCGQVLSLLDALAAAEVRRDGAMCRADIAEDERDALAARLAGAERVVAAAREVYEHDDAWTLATDDGHGRRDRELGKALDAYGAYAADAPSEAGGEGRGTE